MQEKIIKVLKKTAIDGDTLLSIQFRDAAIEIVKLIEKPNNYAQQGKTADVYWFTNVNSHIGVVLTENDRNEQRAYISGVRGSDVDVDEKFIREYGNKLTVIQAIGFFGARIRAGDYQL